MTGLSEAATACEGRGDIPAVQGLNFPVLLLVPCVSCTGACFLGFPGAPCIMTEVPGWSPRVPAAKASSHLLAGWSSSPSALVRFQEMASPDGGKHVLPTPALNFCRQPFFLQPAAYPITCHKPGSGGTTSPPCHRHPPATCQNCWVTCSLQRLLRGWLCPQELASWKVDWRKIAAPSPLQFSDIGWGLASKGTLKEDSGVG